MKKTMITAMLTGLLVTAALPLCAQVGADRQRFDLLGGKSYDGQGTSTMRFVNDGMGLRVSGMASGFPGGGAGFVIDSKIYLDFSVSGASRLIISVSGITETDRFDQQKLLKLELNNVPQRTITEEMRNANDNDYINAQDGEAVFDISRLRNIRKINLVFYNCTIEDLKVEVFYE
jgi:hypothetical protein